MEEHSRNCGILSDRRELIEPKILEEGFNIIPHIGRDSPRGG